MTKMTNFLMVRISGTQNKLLTEAILTEQKSKSTIVREALDNYMEGSKGRIEKQNQWDKKNKNT
jgi:hypothetical protein